MNDGDNRLRLVVSLDDDERDWEACASARDALFVIGGESWLWEPVGCVICLEADEASVSFRAASDPNRFRCMRCGPLLEVPYVLRKDYRLQLGSLERTGEQVIEDSLLFPVCTPADELRARLETMLEEADAELGEDDE